jgi:hypothetical protein
MKKRFKNFRDRLRRQDSRGFLKLLTLLQLLRSPGKQRISAKFTQRQDATSEQTDALPFRLQLDTVHLVGAIFERMQPLFGPAQSYRQDVRRLIPRQEG